MGVETPLPSLELGQTANAYPRPVFDRMFRGRKPVAPNWSRRGAEPPRAAERRIDRIEARHRQELMDLASPGPSRPNLPAGLPKPGTPIWKVTRPLDQDPDKHAD